MANNNTQICATLPKELILQINEEAEKEKRTFSQTVCLLLEYAIREKKRRRINK